MWIGRGSPNNSVSMAITCETTSRTDQPGHSVGRFHSPSVSGATSSETASMDWVQASAYAWTICVSVTFRPLGSGHPGGGPSIDFLAPLAPVAESRRAHKWHVTLPYVTGSAL